MRRSAAPSQLHTVKRPRFNPPVPQASSSSFRTNTDISASSLKEQYENVKPSESLESVKGERTKRDILNLISGVQSEAGTESDGRIHQIDAAQLSSADISDDQVSDIDSSIKNITNLPTNDVSAASGFSKPLRNNVISKKGFRSPQTGGARSCSAPQSLGLESNSSGTGVPKAEIPRKPIFNKGSVSKSQVKFQPPSRSGPALSEKNKPGGIENTDEPKTYYYNVVWCKLSKKKHKKWEGDAILKAKGRSVTLVDTEGKEIGRGSGYKVTELASMAEGHTLAVGGKEIEVMSVLKEEDYTTGKCFQTAAMVTTKTLTTQPRPTVVAKPFTKPQQTGAIQAQPQAPVAVRPKFNPEAPDALVMPRPNKNHEWEHNRQRLPVVDVVVDPHVTHHLRPHQRAGVVFLYQCIMGMKDFTGNGTILADEMGLGKTLQCISLIWTLYKQGPYGGKPVIRRALIITPGSLVKNWVREFRKWLGPERLKVYAVGSDNKAQDFASCTVYPVMIISYEMFIRNIEAVKAVNFDIVVCDEGHRLKNTNIKTTSFMMSLATRKRIVLTGTPVQNDLKELFSVVEFCNPGILGTSSAFHHVYEAPILISRQPSASPAETLLGETRAQELNRVTGMFILRRTQDINNKYLPPKVEVVLFCRPSELQVRLYRTILSSRAVRSCFNSMSTGDPAQHLMCISALKKISNCPSLLHKNAVDGAASENKDPYSTEPELYRGLLPVYPTDYDPAQLALEHCGKLKIVAALLQAAYNTSPRQRVVLVSNYTQTLDVLERLLHDASYTSLRLDGQTPTGKRQQLVERFNSKHSDVFVFLLSSKAGGVGLNLIGATRLILYDIDWNPANDLQAMARIWRDGQQHQVYIYRLLTTGSLEEKMYQRQVSKQGLSGVVVDAKATSKLSFSPEELKDLFCLREDSLCCTHDLLNCDCGDEDRQTSSAVDDQGERACQLQQTAPAANQRNLSMDELLDWRHVRGPAPDLSHVDPLVAGLQIDDVTYAFWNVSGQK